MALLFAFGFDDDAGAILGFSNFAAHARASSQIFFLSQEESLSGPLCVGGHNLTARNSHLHTAPFLVTAKRKAAG